MQDKDLIMTDQIDTADAEFSAMQTLYTTLIGLSAEAQGRVIKYIVDRLALRISGAIKHSWPVNDTDEAEGQNAGRKKFHSLAELHDAAQPKTNSERALVAGYWVQVCEGNEKFDSQTTNTALKHLGHGLANVTAALDSLKNQKPALALQIQKSGKTQQARKTYKITVAGIKAVESMIGG